ncbi:MAG: hypothetical protein HY556_01600 [Euryarchaeota archaeon]|nr:hypothetical protein [Euryarchaeota archaeon]
MKSWQVVAIALLAFALGAIVSNVAAGSGPMSGWTTQEMWDFCRGLMGGSGAGK